MSLLHPIIFHFIKRGQTSYDPSVSPDYEEVRSREVTLDGISGEYLFSDGNSTGQCVPYIRSGMIPSCRN